MRHLTYRQIVAHAFFALALIFVAGVVANLWGGR